MARAAHPTRARAETCRRLAAAAAARNVDVAQPRRAEAHRSGAHAVARVRALLNPRLDFPAVIRRLTPGGVGAAARRPYWRRRAGPPPHIGHLTLQRERRGDVFAVLVRHLRLRQHGGDDAEDEEEPNRPRRQRPAVCDRIDLSQLEEREGGREEHDGRVEQVEPVEEIAQPVRPQVEREAAHKYEREARLHPHHHRRVGLVPLLAPPRLRDLVHGEAAVQHDEQHEHAVDPVRVERSGLAALRPRVHALLAGCAASAPGEPATPPVPQGARIVEPLGAEHTETEEGRWRKLRLAGPAPPRRLRRVPWPPPPSRRNLAQSHIVLLIRIAVPGAHAAPAAVPWKRTLGSWRVDPV